MPHRASLLTPLSEAPGLIPGYQLLERLGGGGRHVVWRARRLADDRAVVLKLPVQGHAVEVARLHHELALAALLPAMAVVPALALDHGPTGPMLVLEDVGGQALSRLVAPGLPLAQLLDLAIGLARALAAVHAGGVMHKDLKPANVIVTPDGGVRLTDFGFAARIAREAPRALPAQQLEGTLAYMAPEQSGRMNRSVDRRADLYALGVTLYELATGVLPFRAEDPLDLIHQHIASLPASPREHRPELPRVLAELILRLLAKDAEARYQSAAGVMADLQQARQRLTEGQIEAFALGRQDADDEFRIPQVLVGREAELRELAGALARTRAGAVQVLLVEGPSGIGKSALVGELTRLATDARALQVQGKFDQFRRDLPYTAVIQAFGQLARRIMTEPQERLLQWRQRLVEALAPNGQVLVDLVPELAPVLGPLPPVRALGLSESQVRFTLVMRNFVRALAAAEHPLVLFLDDLQWADAASLGALQSVLQDAELGHVLVVGALRSAEVTPGHPFALFLHDLETGAGVRPQRLVLGPLDAAGLRELVGRATRLPPAEVAPLAELVGSKTGGNPFYVGEFLREAVRMGLIGRDPASGHCVWQLEALRQRHTTGNVVDLVITRLSDLPAATRRALQQAAVVGHQFDLATLAQASGQAPADLLPLLAPALDHEVLLPVGDAYKYAHLADTLDGAAQITLAFLHDRVQQAVYDLIDAAERPAAHHRVGSLLLGAPAAEVDARLFDIATHFDAAVGEVRPGAEALAVAGLFLRAARKANGSMAWDAARRYARAGRLLLGTQGWAQHETMMGLSEQALEAAFLLSDRAELEAIHDEIVQRARSSVTRADATTVKIQLLVSGMAYGEALDVAIPVLASLGVQLPRRGHQGQVVASLLRTRWALRGHRVEQLADRPAMQEPELLAAMRVMVAVSSAAYTNEPQLFPQIVFELVRRSIHHGNAPQSAFGYVCYGLAMCAVLGDHDTGLAFGQLALAVMDRTHARDFEAKVRFLGSLFIDPWSRPLGQTLEPFRLGAAAGLETGDLEYYSYCFYGLDSHTLMAGMDLAALAQSSAAHHEATLRHKQRKVGLVMLLVRETVGWLRDEPALVVDGVDEAQVLAQAQASGDTTSVAYAHAWRCCRAYLGGDLHAVLAAAAGCRAHQAGIDGQLFVPLYQFYEALALCALARQGRAQPGWARRVNAHRRRLRRWAARVPETFAARLAMLEAELLRQAGRSTEALQAHERALVAAEAAANLHDLALAHQLAGDCAAAAGLATVARAHRQRARQGWQRWGALRLVRQLDEQHPGLALAEVLGLGGSAGAAASAGPGGSLLSGGAAAPARAGATGRSGSATRPGSASTAGSTSGSGSGDELDAQAIRRAAQAVSGQLRLPDVVRELCAVLLAHAGARQVVLVVRRGEGEWRVLAAAHVDRPGLPALVDQTLAEAGVFEAAVHLALRSRHDLVLDDAQQDPLFRTDPHVLARGSRSVLCSPMLRHGELVGAILLENELVAGAFTRERAEFIQVIASQAAISIENAGLVQELEQSLDAQIALTRAHARFVPHQFLASLGRQNIQEVRLGDHAAKTLSVLFSDIRGFTPLIGRLGPRASIDFINAYIGHMEPAILAHRGFIDTYLGDAIMALFDGEADDAVAAGVAMLAALQGFNAARVAAGEAGVAMGIGINTGPLMLGTIGGPNRIKCGVIGDPVNLAARIEGLTKQMGLSMLVGEETVASLRRPDDHLLRPVGRVVVVGRSTPVEVHEAFGADPPALRDAKREGLAAYRRGWAAYHARAWGEAQADFALALQACPQDTAAQAYLLRSRELLADPPGPAWDGVETLQRK